VEKETLAIGGSAGEAIAGRVAEGKKEPGWTPRLVAAAG
jgi:hypothetical protein